MTTPESNPLPPTELKSDEECARDIFAFLFSKEQSVALSELAQLTSLISAHTGQLRQRIETLEELRNGDGELMNKMRETLRACSDPAGGPLAMAPDRITAYVEMLRVQSGDNPISYVHLKDRVHKAESDATQLRDRLALVEKENESLKSERGNWRVSSVCRELHEKLALVEKERDKARDHDKAVCQALEARSSMLSAEQDKSERYRLVTLKQDAELSALRQQAARDGARLSAYDETMHDGFAVYSRLTETQKKFTTTENVSAVLDAFKASARAAVDSAREGSK